MEVSPELLTKLIDVGGSVLLGIATLIIGNMVAKWMGGLVRKLCNNRGTGPELAGFLGNLVRYLVLAAAIIAALERMGVETTSAIAILGSAGLAIGLAMQGSLSNFAAGVMILFFKPFRQGDVITAGGETGGVTDIGLFATTMVTPSNRKIIVPNTAITGGNITNYTTLGTRRETVAVGVAYGADVGQVMEVLMGAATRSDKVMSDPAPAVAFVDMAASSLNFAVHIWTTSDDWLDGLHNVRRACYEDLNAAGIEIPYDQIVVHQAAAA